MSFPCRHVCGSRVRLGISLKPSGTTRIRRIRDSITPSTATHCGMCSSIPRLQYYSDQSHGDSSSSFQYTFPSHLRNPSPYDILQIPKTTPPSEIKARYYELVKRLHPDRHRHCHSSDAKGKGKAKDDSSSSSSSSSSAEQFHQVVKAYELLSNNTKRKAFDRYGFGWAPAGSSSSAASHSGYGTFGAATRQEWSELQRRRGFSSPGPGPTSAEWWTSHDQTGWQRDSASASGGAGAGAGLDDAAFFASRQQAATGGAGGGPTYGPNSRIISIVALVTWTLALVQFNRISTKTDQAQLVAGQRHREAAHSYQEVKGRAQSLEGRRRFENLRVRAREQKVLDQVDAHRDRDLADGDPASTSTTTMHALPPPQNNLQP